MASTEYNLRVKRPRKKPVRTIRKKCKTCNQEFPNQDSLDEHNLIHNTGKPFACLYCSYRSALKDIMRNHIHIQHGILMKRTDIVTQDMLEIVIQRCTICNTDFPNRDSLHAHHLSNKSCKPFRCEYCDKLVLKLTQENGSSLRIITVQNANRTNLGKTHTQTNNVNRNTKKTGKPTKEKYLTDQTSDIDNSIDASETTIKTEENESCDLAENEDEYDDYEEEEEELCNIETAGDDGKRKSDQIYKCTMCNQPFFSKATLHSHTLSHCGSKPFTCPHCDYRSRLRGIMKNHVEIRHGISMKINDITREKRDKMYTRAFHCKSCNKIFASKERLHEHRLDNNLCKPFQCFYCEYRCLMKTTMKRHIKGRHGKDVNCSEIHPERSHLIKINDDAATNKDDKSNETDIKLELGDTEIMPKTDIKQEIVVEDELSNDIDTKYDINNGLIFTEEEILNNLENDMSCILDEETELVDVKEEIITNDECFLMQDD